MPWSLARVSPPTGTDIVHAGSWQAFAFKRPGIPLVITEHQYIKHPAFIPFRGRFQSLYHRWLVERWMSKSYACADAIVAVSNFCAGPMRKDLEREIFVIHNWVDTELFVPSRHEQNNDAGYADRKKFRLLFVGNPSRWKGVDLLPEIAQRLGDKFQIYCMGGLRKQFESDQLLKNMVLLPRCAPEQMPSVYQSMDSVLIPARYEAFGYVALEAMACGVPVVGFNTSGVAEVCRNDETALLAPIGDVQALVQFVFQLADNSRLKEQLSDAGRRRALECFTEHQAIEKYLDIYVQVARRMANDG
jgi:glycosyltransferase involved in cell wall biosynthesis